MHIPNAVLDPRVAATTAVVAGSGLAFCLARVEKRLGEKTTVLMGTMAAFVFAAQMVNFPLGPLAVSGHLLGGVLAAVMLGPWAGAVVIGAVLIVQCLMFGDGGLTALGANFLNMGLIGSAGGYAIYSPIRRAIGGKSGILIGAMAAAWFSVILAAGAFSLELTASGHRSDFGRVLGWMTLVHAAIGVGEAIITGLVLRFILLTRPDLVYDEADRLVDTAPPARRTGREWVQVGVAGVGVALVVVMFLAPFASTHPDGLEFVVGEKLNLLKEDTPSTLPVPIPDYELPIFGPRALGAATAAAGVVGTLVVFAFALGLAKVVERARPSGLSAGPGGVSPDAA